MSTLLVISALVLIWFAWNVVGPVAEQRRLANNPEARKLDALGWVLLCAALLVSYLAGNLR